mgnify:CR=1 FL=1
MNQIFYFACFLLPFENLFFAPSAGWGALTPIVFAFYVLINFKYLNKVVNRYKKIIVVALIGIVITLINMIFINNKEIVLAVTRMANTIIILGLGFVNLFAFDIYINQKHGSIKKIEKILIITYTISLFVGVLQFFALKFNISIIRQLDLILSKRSYLPYNRVQFTFTEPSFIGMHLFGILLPIYIYGNNKKIRNLIIVFSVLSVVFGSGVRILLDIAVVVGVLILQKLDMRKAKNIIIVFGSILILIIGGRYVYSNNYRVQQIVKDGVYADGSFASRWFRVNASIKGYQKDWTHALLGYGYGQEIYPLKQGYNEAAIEYKNAYIVEVQQLRNAETTAEESTSYCFYIRIVSEMGLIIFVILVCWFVKEWLKIKDGMWRALLTIVVYLLLQFESYAFYTIWLVMALLIRYKREKTEKISRNLEKE